MAKAEGIPPTASVASVGPGLRYLGTNHCYAYSGNVGVDNTTTTLLEFTTGSGYIVANIKFAYVDSNFLGAEDFFYKIRLNGLMVFGLIVDQAKISSGLMDWELDLIIPPFTDFLATASNESDTDSRNQAAKFTGRVYDA